MEENKSFQFSTSKRRWDDLRAGKIILCTDDPDRENEGDFICAAQFATTENVNFMAVHGKGLICMPMSAELCQKLAFSPNGHREHRQPRNRLHRVHRPRRHHNGHLGRKSAG